MRIFEHFKKGGHPQSEVPMPLEQPASEVLKGIKVSDVHHGVLCKSLDDVKAALVKFPALPGSKVFQVFNPSRDEVDFKYFYDRNGRKIDEPTDQDVLQEAILPRLTADQEKLSRGEVSVIDYSHTSFAGRVKFGVTKIVVTPTHNTHYPFLLHINHPANNAAENELAESIHRPKGFKERIITVENPDSNFRYSSWAASGLLLAAAEKFGEGVVAFPDQRSLDDQYREAIKRQWMSGVKLYTEGNITVEFREDTYGSVSFHITHNNDFQRYADYTTITSPVDLEIVNRLTDKISKLFESK